MQEVEQLLKGMFVDLVAQKTLCGGTGKRSSFSYVRIPSKCVHVEKTTLLLTL
jgi:hypothetical protein